ncbi:hypothetical protein B0T16DRAFT_518489 [Cercophora newfieldiana]|uniref:Uncharacterized protein n=1 Tax=Cercophora newfieldiana TaxID=92897 RepID=A0AA40CIC5_9PEZI|nr:hypothetical protein B0T16DRAFT_518489 [Cercophora newfieldiana]
MPPTQQSHWRILWEFVLQSALIVLNAAGVVMRWATAWPVWEIPRLVKWFVVFLWVIWVGIFFGLVSITGEVKSVITVGILSAVWIIILSAVVWFTQLRDYVGGWFFWSRATAPWNPNIANTIITLLVATIAVPLLYWQVWWPDLNHRVLTLERDTVMQEEANFPSFTLFQRADWTSQANLQSGVSPKCFLGWHDESAPECGPDRALPCQCSGSWGDSIGDFKWQNTSYRALKFQASEDMMSASPTVQVIAQTFFSYDSKKANQDSSRTLSPSLYIAVHDPTLTVEEALANGYTRMVLINANGMVAINLGLESREALGHAPANDYQLTISTVPSMTMECDASAACFLTLIFQFPSFERQVLRQDVKLKWADVASLAGSWFALFQVAGWILSGAAWHI